MIAFLTMVTFILLFVGIICAVLFDGEKGAIIFSTACITIAICLILFMVFLMPIMQEQFCIVAREHITTREPIMWRFKCFIKTGIDNPLYMSIEDYAIMIMRNESGLE